MSHIAQLDLLAPLAEPVPEPDLGSYDRYAIAFSGGKDSIALVARLLDAGVPRDRIELHHHCVDDGSDFVDWSCTEAYCREVARALGIRIYFSGKRGGFEREMMRDGALTAPTWWESESGEVVEVGGDRGKPGTRLKFPQVTADLSVRWCSAYLKVDILAALIRNEPRFQRSRTLVLTGERGAESAARARYKAFEPDRSDLRDGGRNWRIVDRWRAVHAWTEEQVWDAMRRLGIVPHPAYRLGFARLSCLACIFASAHQWSTIRACWPERFEVIAARESSLGCTIQRSRSVREMAAAGRPYPAALAQPELVRVAASREWIGGPVLVAPDAWMLPAGAFGEDRAGPS